MEILSLFFTIPLAVVLSLGSFTLAKDFIFENCEDMSDRLANIPALLFYIPSAVLFWFATLHILTQ